MPLTLKAALKLLEGRGFTISPDAIKRAAKSKALKTTLIDAPIKYYVVTEQDVIDWAENRQVRRGNPNFGKEFGNGRKPANRKETT